MIFVSIEQNPRAAQFLHSNFSRKWNIWNWMKKFERSNKEEEIPKIASQNSTKNNLQRNNLLCYPCYVWFGQQYPKAM